MSDLEEELLGLAEDDPYRRKKSKSKSKAYIEDSEDDEEGEEEMDMDLDESDDDDGPSIPPPRAKVNTNPYPLEGKYIDEDDRERLEDMPEIQREEILAGRIEEMQKFRDSMQLDMMLGGRVDDDDDDSNRKKRKHTSVSKEATRAMTDLKKKRKAKDERATRRAQRREQRHRESPASDSHSTEDGEISRFDSYRRSPPPSPPRKVNRDKEDRNTFDVDAAPISAADLNSARLSRYELVEMLYKDGFDSVVTGSYVRLMAKELDPMGRPKYRINKVVAVTDQNDSGPYPIEYKGRSILDGRGLMCSYGKVQRLYRIADVSNSDFQTGEYTRFEMTNRADGIKMPKRSELNKKHAAIKELRDRPMSNEEVDRQVHARRQANPLAQRAKNAVEISGLIQARNLALRRNDTKAVQQLDAEIINLGGDPATGEMLDEHVSSQGTFTGEDYDAKIQRINENHKRKTKEAMMAATQAAIARKKAEEAIVRANRNHSNSPAPAAIPKVVPPPASGLKKGETPQQYVARTIDLDLGDF